MVDITSSVQKEVSRAEVKDGICVVYVPHTTAGVTVNEGADPDVCEDIEAKMNELVPSHRGYRHTEGMRIATSRLRLLGVPFHCS